MRVAHVLDHAEVTCTPLLDDALDARGPRPRSRRKSVARPGDEKRWAIHGFLGAALLTGALLLPHANPLPIAGGIALAGVIRWVWRSAVNRSL
jgi:hypothetical protein